METYMKYKNKIIITFFLLILISVQEIYARGKQDTLPADKLHFNYKLSNNGIIYDFFESIALPEGANIGILNLYNLNSKAPPISNKIQLGEMKTFKYSLTHPYKAFYPLLPFIATLTIIDNNGNPLRVSETKFNSYFTFYNNNTTNTETKISGPILFSLDSKDAIDSQKFSAQYEISDEQFMNKLIAQMKLSIANYQGEEKHILVTGISFSDEKTANMYQHILDKTYILEDIINKFEDITSIEIDVLFYPKSSAEYEDNLYPHHDQAVIRISSNKSNLLEIQNTHIKSNINYIKNIQNQLYDEYYILKTKIKTAMKNTVQATRIYEQMKNLLGKQKSKEYKIKSETLDIKMADWIEKANKISNTLNILETQFDNMESGQAISSLTTVLNTINNSKLENVSMFDELLSLKIGNKNNINYLKNATYEYKNRKEIITIYQSENKKLIELYTEYQKEFIIQKEYFDNKINIEKITYLLEQLTKIEDIFDKIDTLHYEYSNYSKPVLIARITNLQNFTEITQQLKTTIVNLSTTLKSLSTNNVRDSNIIPEKNSSDRLEIITLETNNILATSQYLIYKDISIDTILSLTQSTEQSYQKYKYILSQVTPILAAQDKSIINNLITSSGEVSFFKIPNENNKIIPSINTDNSISPAEPSFDITYDQLVNQNSNNDEKYTESTQSISSSVYDSLEFDEYEGLSSFELPYTPPINTNVSNNENTKNIQTVTYKNILGRGTLQQNQIINYINDNLRGAPHADIPKLVEFYFYEAEIEQVIPEIAIAQMLYITDMLQTKEFFARYNPAGLGGPNSKNWEIYPFQNLSTGVRAHIQHLKGYASKNGLEQDPVDPRYHILENNGLIGSATTLEEITRSWYSPHSLASNNINTILKDMNTY